MPETISCNLCDNPGTFSDSPEVGKVACHVECFREETFTVWRCKNCNALHSKEDVDLPRYYARYPFQKHKLDLHTRVGYRNRIRLLEGIGLSRRHSLLDFGCGKGLFLQILRSYGYNDVHGYDEFIPEFSDKAVCDRSYDVVVSYDVIEHVESPIDFLNSMIRLVKPGGLLVIGTPNADRLSISTTGNSAVELSQPYHRHILSGNFLLSKAKDLGLTPLHIYSRFYFDSLVPTVNTRFMWKYIEKTGNMIDVAVEPLRLMEVLSSPVLIFYAFFGYFFPPRGNILMSFRVPAVKLASQPSAKIANS